MLKSKLKDMKLHWSIFPFRNHSTLPEAILIFWRPTIDRFESISTSSLRWPNKKMYLSLENGINILHVASSSPSEQSFSPSQMKSCGMQVSFPVALLIEDFDLLLHHGIIDDNIYLYNF